MVKKMVRLALSTEYSRQVIRRTDISAKVLGEQGSRQFKLVFEGAQKLLRERFGMQMVELPAKEKVTISQRRGRWSFFFFSQSLRREREGGNEIDNANGIHSGTKS